MGGVLHEGCWTTKITQQPNNKHKKSTTEQSYHEYRGYQARSVDKKHTMPTDEVDNTPKDNRIHDTKIISAEVFLRQLWTESGLFGWRHFREGCSIRWLSKQEMNLDRRSCVREVGILLLSGWGDAMGREQFLCIGSCTITSCRICGKGKIVLLYVVFWDLAI